MASQILQTLAGRPKTLFSDAVRRWFRYIERFTARTQEHYRMVLLRFSAPRYLKDLTLEHIEIYLDSVKFSNRTKNSHLTALKSFCRWASERYDIPNPCLKIKMLPESPPKVRVLTEEEYRKVLAVCSDSEAKIVKFIANTGLRLTEIRTLQPGNVRDDFLTITGKGRKHRLIPVNYTCREILHSTHLNFLKSYRKRWALYQLCRRLARRAAIPQFGPHALRHYFATALMKKGVPLAKISRILGHSSIQTTERIYIHWLPDDLAGVTDCLDS